MTKKFTKFDQFKTIKYPYSIQYNIVMYFCIFLKQRDYVHTEHASMSLLKTLFMVKWSHF